MAWKIALLLFSLHLYAGRAVDYKFDGKSYILFSPSAKSSKTNSMIHMLFKTAETSGVLLHARRTNSDFITLEIVRGKLRYASVFERNGAKPGTHDVMFDDVIVSDEQWHQIDITRNKHEVKIILDVTRKFLPGEQLHDYHNITIGGLPLSIPSNIPRNTSIPLQNPSSSSLPQMSLTGTGFKGCMEDATFNDNNIFQATKEKSKDVHVLGTLWPKCSDDTKYTPATLSKSTSYIKLGSVNGEDVNLKFKFFTFDNTGLLVHHGFGTNVKNKLFVELVRGKLILNLVSQHLNINTIISTKYANYGNGLWHNIRLNLTSKGIGIRVNNETATTFLNNKSGYKNLLQNPMLKIGTNLKDRPSVKACIRDIQLNGKDIEVTSSISQDVAFDKCYLTDLCFINPCLHGGICQQYNNTIQCDCSNTGYYGSRCQNVSTIKPTLTTSTKAKSTRKDITVQPSTTMPDKLPITSPPSTKLQKIHSTQSSDLRNTTQNSRAYQSIRTMTKKTFTVKPSQFISSYSKRTTAGQLKQPMTGTSGQIPTGKPKRVIATENENFSTVKPKQSTTSIDKQTFTASMKQSLPATRSPGSHFNQVTTSINKQTFTASMKQSLPATRSPGSHFNQVTTTISKLTDQVKQITTTSSIVKLRQTPTRKVILSVKSNPSISPNYEQATTPRPKPTPSPATPEQPTLHLTLPKGQTPTRNTTFSPHQPSQRQPLTTAGSPTNKIKTQIIIIQKSNTITKVGFNKNQLLVYLFLFIVFVLFVGLIVIISVKMSYFNACPCLRRFQTVNGSLPSQDSIELANTRRKDSTTAVRVKTDRPSSLNDSGIDRSESGTDSHRSSAEVQDDDLTNREDLETSLSERGDLETSPESEGFLILQDDPPLYTQQSFGWTILSSANTIRHCRTSTRDLIHAATENKPRVFKPAYYSNSEISDDGRVDDDGDVTRCRNPTTKYRELASSDCSSFDDVSIDIEECTGLKRNCEEECPVF